MGKAAPYRPRLKPQPHHPLIPRSSGNGCLGSEVGICGNGIDGDYFTLAQMWGHGFVSNANWEAANAACGNWTGNPSSACDRAIRAAGNDIG